MYYDYGVLGLPQTASVEDIKKAYRALAKEYHPDIVGNTPENVRRFQEIGQAYQSLLAEKTRPIPQAYPVYPPYPHHYGNAPPPEEKFQSYTWEKVWEEPVTKKKAPKPPPPPPVVEEKEPEPPPKPIESQIPEEFLEVSRIEACQEALRRVEEEYEDVAEELLAEIEQYLKKEYTVTQHQGMFGFTITSEKTKTKVSVRNGQGKFNIFGKGN